MHDQEKEQGTPACVVSSHPAVRAWSQLDVGLSKAERVETIKHGSSTNTQVFRLAGAGVNGSAVIAKKTDKSLAMVERCIYESALRHLKKPTLKYYGHLEDSEQTCWLFVEDAGDALFSFKNSRHRARALDWLSDLHTSIPKHDHFPERGVDYNHHVLVAARASIIRNRGNVNLHTADIEVLEKTISHLDRLENRWDAVRTIYDQLPKGLIHGDFKSKNIRLANKSGHADSLLVFDWEYAGWGLPGVDLWYLDAKEYWRKVRNLNAGSDLPTVMMSYRLGRIFRCLNGIKWTVESLRHQWVDSPMLRMASYNKKLSEVTECITWP